jgi:hypothetical protein
MSYFWIRAWRFLPAAFVCHHLPGGVLQQGADVPERPSGLN